MNADAPESWARASSVDIIARMSEVTVSITPVSSVRVRKVGGGYVVSCEAPDPNANWNMQLQAGMSVATRPTVSREYIAGTLEAVNALLNALLTVEQ